METFTYTVADCKGSELNTLATFLTRGKFKHCTVVYDADSSMLDLLATSGRAAVGGPKDHGAAHVRVRFGACDAGTFAGIPACGEFQAADVIAAFKLADASSAYRLTLTLHSDDHTARITLDDGSPSPIAAVGSEPLLDGNNAHYTKNTLDFSAYSVVESAYVPYSTREFDGKRIAAAAKTVAMSAASTGTRPMLQGVHMVCTDDGARLETTDRFRLMRMPVEAAACEDCEGEPVGEAVFDAAAFAAIAYAFAARKAATTIVRVNTGTDNAPSRVYVRGSIFGQFDVVVALHCMENAFPKLEHLLSIDGYGAQLTASVKAADLVAAVKKLRPTWKSRKAAAPIRLSGNGDALAVWDPVTEMFVRFDGVSCAVFDIAFNPRFLVEALQQGADADGRVELRGHCDGDGVVSHKPVMFRPVAAAADAAVAVLVPMRFGDADSKASTCPAWTAETAETAEHAAGEPRAVESAIADGRVEAAPQSAAAESQCEPATTVETADVPVVSADDTTADTDMPTVDEAPRTVESAPTLPAECSAETVEIPEVPPTTNSDAHVLAVSESVILTGQSVTDAYGVAYRAVHYVRRVVERRDGTTAKKKVAAVFRLGDTVYVVRRDRYEDAGRDAAVEAEIAAHVERLQRAA